MEDPTDTIIISGIHEKTNLFEFSYLVCQEGKVKVLDLKNERGEGIVTYDNAKEAKEAAKTLDGKKFNGSEIRAETAQDHYTHSKIKEAEHRRKEISSSFPGDVKVNSAWLIWLFDHMARYSKAGEGGKGGEGMCGFGRGEDGKPGEPGPGGKGGEGGKGGSCHIS